MNTTKYLPVVQELIDMIAKNGWQSKFDEAFKNAKALNVVEFKDIKTLEDYFDWINKQLTWIPFETNDGREVYRHVCKFYFLLDQSPVKELQNKITAHDKMQPLTPLSAWIVKWVNAFGQFMDTPESLTPDSERTFYDTPIYNMREYDRPRGGWRTFNQLFARRLKPGYRPIAAITDDSVIVSPADSVFDGQWEVRSDSHVNIKGIYWKIQELLQDSPYKDCFEGGQWCHAFLNTNDYHRQHAPVGGKVLEARVIPGTAYLQVIADVIPGDSVNKKIGMRRTFDAPDDPGYEFIQARGLIVIESQIGKVAILPMGMAQVSSVVVTAEKGVTLQKGEEISYFQFGGSDIVMVFERKSNVNFTTHQGVHNLVGRQIAKAYPVR